VDAIKEVFELTCDLAEARRAILFADKMISAHDEGKTAITSLDSMEQFKAVVQKCGGEK
jgi:hypothetical protein